jgi:hypothetical protein
LKKLIAARYEAAVKPKFGYAVKLLDVLSASEAGNSIAEHNERTQAASIAESTALYS